MYCEYSKYSIGTLDIEYLSEASRTDEFVETTDCRAEIEYSHGETVGFIQTVEINHETEKFYEFLTRPECELTA